MNQRIGNVGVLNLTNATAESIQGIERIENVGIVFYKKETAPLLSALNIGNIGSSVEIPEGFQVLNGVLHVNGAYLEGITGPVHLMVNGNVIIDKDVREDQLKKEQLQLIVNGKIYAPDHLASSINRLLKNGSGNVTTYQDAPPRFENGIFTVSNSFLESIEEPLTLVVNGIVELEKELDLALFTEKISKLEVNGIAFLHQEQEATLYKKVASFTSCRKEVIPAGFDYIKKLPRLNARSIRRFTNKNVFTKKPVIIEADVTREMLTNAFAGINTKSVIICHEQLEDLVYELTNVEAEVLSYETNFVMIEGEEVWSNDQFLALKTPTNFIVKGQLTLDQDVTEEVLFEKVATLDVLGEVIVSEKKVKGSLQNMIRVCTGRIGEAFSNETSATLNNVGELSL
ncbi:hypothetical protein H1D32_02745 [Anaerobacillus sp. CMMVII]|uniref:hypothetical protein n=1 Tax=Anaerobacillus sp. CMMVII TaxID=2755588 RepID=UPI0021B7C8EB|nr:hypothetical protein [Anaerobacillus sp. CMMVII]MCT8136767.1 hypothetical protein [Anaerobacillus sp. CMMVII]